MWCSVVASASVPAMVLFAYSSCSLSHVTAMLHLLHCSLVRARACSGQQAEACAVQVHAPDGNEDDEYIVGRQHSACVLDHVMPNDHVTIEPTIRKVPDDLATGSSSLKHVAPPSGVDNGGSASAEEPWQRGSEGAAPTG